MSLDNDSVTIFDKSMIATAPVMDGAADGIDVNGDADGSSLGDLVTYESQSLHIHSGTVTQEQITHYFDFKSCK